MPVARIIQNSFSSGEVAPEMYGRVDLQQYANGLKTCSNFIVKPHGGLVSRPGFEHVCEVKDSSKTVRLIPFNFNTEQTYVLEFGDYYMRVIANGGLVTEDAVTILSTTEDNPVEVTTSASHGYSTGDYVYISGVGTATTLNGRWFTVTYIDADEFSLDDEDGTGIGVGSGGTVERAYVLTTPYSEADVADLDYTQSADTMTLVHSDWTPRELTRTDHDAWTLTEITFGPIIGKPQNLAVNGSTGTYEYAVTAVDEETGEESRAALVSSDYSQPETLTWNDVTGASGYNVYRDDGGSHRKHGLIGTTTESDFEDPGADADDEIEPEWAISPPDGLSPFGGNPIAIDDVSTDNPCQITTTTAHGYSTGDRVFIDDEGDEPDINNTWFTITKIDADEFSLDGIDGTAFTWTEGGNVEKFDGNDNCPSCVTYYEQRLIFAATNNDPQRIWMSQSAAFHNMDTSRPSRDSDAIIFTIAAQEVNRINNLVPMRDLIVLTSGGEWRANGGESEVMTATGGLAVRRQTGYGSGSLPAITVGNTTIYYQERGPAIRTIAYSFADDQYMGVDLSILSRHLLDGYTLSDWAYAQAPNGVIWCVRSDGALLGLTYQHEHKVWAWHQHSTPDGEFEGVASILENSEDALYAVVKRDINGTDHRFIERLHSRYFTVAHDCFFVDAGLTLDSPIAISDITAAEPPVVTTAVSHGLSDGDYVDLSDVAGMTEVNLHQYKIANKTADTFELTDPETDDDIDGSGFTAYDSGGYVREAVTTIRGLDHLNGESVTILANGMHHPNETVSGGSVTLDYPASRVHIGLGYTCEMETLDLDVPSQSGTLQGTQQSVRRVVLRVQDSIGASVGPNSDSLTEIPWRESDDYLPIELYTGDRTQAIESDWDLGARVIVQQTVPLPLAINAIIAEVRLGT